MTTDDPIYNLILRAWRRKNTLFYLLLPVSWLFFVLVWLRRKLYQIGVLKSHALPVPVIVVGNIHMGGSGKTPVVIWLVEYLKSQGFTPGVISRGYGVSNEQVRAVTTESSAADAGDEPLLIAQRSACPVFVGVNRVAAAEALLAAHPRCNVLISDDGLQHYRLKRDVEIAVVDTDAKDLRGKRLLPAGPLREPISRLDEVDIVLNHGETKLARPNAFQMRLQGNTFYNLLSPELLATAAYFKRKTIKAMAGIGRPQRFFDHLNHLGLTFATIEFADHQPYMREDLANIDADVLVMTEKDAVKCKAYAQTNYWVLPVAANIDPGFGEKVLEKIARK